MSQYSGDFDRRRPVTEDAEEAYQRGLEEGERKAMKTSIEKAHSRLDQHDGRLTALERVMYAGLGVVFLINILPKLSAMVAT